MLWHSMLSMKLSLTSIKACSIQNHKSYYNNDNIHIFSMAHTLAPSGYLKTIPARVDKVVEWYTTRKISQRETAKKLINDLMNDNKRSVTFAKKI